jgi:hypothetical protein
MLLSDYQSKLMNSAIEEDAIQTFIDGQTNLKLGSIDEAEQTIKEYIKMMK